MQTLIEALREIIGTPVFYKQLSGYNGSYTWDYGAMLEYAVCAIVLCVVISSVFKFLRALIK